MSHQLKLSQPRKSLDRITKSDQEYLVCHLNAGKHWAFQVIHSTHHRSLCYYATEFLSGNSDAEDIVADVFITLWRQREVFKDTHHIKAFLYVSTRNACLNYLKRREHTQKYIITSRREIALDESNDWLSAEIYNTDMLQAINRNILTLPPQARRVLHLTLQGLDTEVIADIMGLSAQTVRNTRARAVRMLKERILQYLLPVEPES